MNSTLWEDHREVNEAAERILLPLNGLSKLVLNSRKPLSTSGLYKVANDGKERHYLVTEAGSLSMQGSANVLKFGDDETNQAVQQQDPMRSQISLARTDNKVNQY